MNLFPSYDHISNHLNLFTFNKITDNANENLMFNGSTTILSYKNCCLIIIIFLLDLNRCKWPNIFECIDYSIFCHSFNSSPNCFDRYLLVAFRFKRRTTVIVCGMNCDFGIGTLFSIEIVFKAVAISIT